MCLRTEFYWTRPEIVYEIGKGTPTTLTFGEPPDKVSMTVTPPDISGLIYCGARTYTFDPATQLNPPKNAGGDLAISLSGKEISVQSSSALDYGLYTMKIIILLDQYPGMTGKEVNVDIKITPTCSAAIWTTPTIPPILGSVKAQPVISTFAAFTYDLQTDLANYCGSIIYELEGGNTNYLTFRGSPYLELKVET